jgi:DNA primase
VAAVIEALGIEHVAETSSVFLCYCPFHVNTDTPAFAVNKLEGTYICFNASCSARAGGNLISLVTKLSKRTHMEALRLIAKKGSETQRPLSVKIAALAAEERWPTIPQVKLDELIDNLWTDERAQAYLASRGFETETLRHFEVGYDPAKDMIVVPIHDKDGNPIGVNGRSIEGKRFKLTRRIPRNQILFNMHRAKQAGGTAIFCESQFDVMRINQAGYPNAVCALGSHISAEQAGLLQRYFDRVIIMTDADEAGRKAGHTLSAMLRGMRVEWAIYDWGEVYPHDAKDAGDMEDDEIAHCIDNAVSDIAYKSFRSLAQS